MILTAFAPTAAMAGPGLAAAAQAASDRGSEASSPRVPEGDGRENDAYRNEVQSDAPFEGRPRGVLSVLYENDHFGGTDENYTNGLRVVYVSPAAEGGRLARFFLRARAPADTRFAVSAGQSMFTAEDKNIAAPLSDQHPYAGWLYVSGASIVERSGGAKLGFGGRSRRGPVDILAVSAGVVGPAALGEETQRTVHRITAAQDVLGWDNQLRNEPAFVAEFDRIWRPFDPGEDFGVDFLPHAGVSAGTVLTEARAGATLRFGRNIGDELGPARVSPSIPGGGYYEGRGGASWQVFAGAQARAIAHNIFIDGGVFRDDPPGGINIERETFVGEFQVGTAVRLGRMQFSYTHVFRSKEFDTQTNDFMEFGAFSLSAAF